MGWKSKLLGLFRRKQPDIYDVLKKYCEDRGLDPGDVTAAAVSAWLSGDDESKRDLENAFAKMRAGRRGIGDYENFISMFKEFTAVFNETFKTINEARANLSIQSMLSDFRAVSNALNEMQRMGAESGKGSVEDLLATALLSNLLGGRVPRKVVRSGSGEVKKIGEEEES